MPSSQVEALEDLPKLRQQRGDLATSVTGWIGHWSAKYPGKERSFVTCDVDEVSCMTILDYISWDCCMGSTEYLSIRSLTLINSGFGFWYPSMEAEHCERDASSCSSSCHPIAEFVCLMNGEAYMHLKDIGAKTRCNVNLRPILRVVSTSLLWYCPWETAGSEHWLHFHIKRYHTFSKQPTLNLLVKLCSWCMGPAFSRPALPCTLVARR